MTEPCVVLDRDGRVVRTHKGGFGQALGHHQSYETYATVDTLKQWANKVADFKLIPPEGPYTSRQKIRGKYKDVYYRRDHERDIDLVIFHNQRVTKWLAEGDIRAWRYELEGK